MQHVDRRCRLLGRESLGNVEAVEGKVALYGVGLRLIHLEGAGKTAVQLRAAPSEDARELAEAPVRDGESRALVADRNGDECRLGPIGRRRDRAEKGERLE